MECLKDHLVEGNRALDVGSGTGYLTACMSLMVRLCYFSLFLLVFGLCIELLQQRALMFWEFFSLSYKCRIFDGNFSVLSGLKIEIKLGLLTLQIGVGGRVIGIDHIRELVEHSIDNVRKHHANLLESGQLAFVEGDGRWGYKPYAPYHAIHVGAASPVLPVHVCHYFQVLFSQTIWKLHRLLKLQNSLLLLWASNLFLELYNAKCSYLVLKDFAVV